MSRPFWLSVAVRKLPDEFVDGIVLAEGFEQENEPEAEQLSYVILARTLANTESEAKSLVDKAVEELHSFGSVLIAFDTKTVVRQERRAAASLKPNEVMLKASFVGFKADSEAAKAAAMEIVQEAIRKRWWQFWR